MIVFGPLWFVVAVMAVYFVLRIGLVLGGRPPAFDPNRYNTAPLPKRTYEELKAHDDALQTEWVTYILPWGFYGRSGRTPPLRLKIRGNSYEGFRRVMRKYIDRTGQDLITMDDVEHMRSLLPVVTAEAHVIEWEGAQYQNGAPMPYSPANLAQFMAADPHLMPFVSQEAGRISPPWPTR